VAKLCDVFPDGRSRLLSFGVINLNHYKSNQEPEQLDLEKRWLSLEILDLPLA
jgi:predicted acyl esterase